MKTLTVQEAQGQLGQLIAEANRGDVIMLTNGTQRVTLTAGEQLDPEQDSPELEAELLKSIDGPYSPYSSDEMRAIVERIIREENSCAPPKSSVRSGIFVESTTKQFPAPAGRNLNSPQPMIDGCLLPNMMPLLRSLRFHGVAFLQRCRP